MRSPSGSRACAAISGRNKRLCVRAGRFPRGGVCAKAQPRPSRRRPPGGQRRAALAARAPCGSRVWDTDGFGRGGAGRSGIFIPVDVDEVARVEAF